MIGKQIAHYKIIEKLGGGGMGVVYKARDTKLDRYVALKFLPHHLSHDEVEKQRFVREAKAASALDHPNICTVYEIAEANNGQSYIAMAYYEGETLKKKIKEQRLKIKDIIDIALQIANGLKKAHENNIIHRDIKPANIMITKEGNAKIVDFGLAKLSDHTVLTKTNTTMGTVAYMSPEQIEGELVDHRSDIWSLGVVLYEMLTGELPFKGEYEQAIMYSIINNEPTQLKKFENKEIEDFQNIINKVLHKEPKNRYQNIDQLIDDFQLLLEGSSKAIKAAKATKIQRSKIRIGAVYIVSFLVLTVVIIFLYKINKSPEPVLPSKHKQITFTGSANLPAVSPDKQFLVYVEEKNKVIIRDIINNQESIIYKSDSPIYSQPIWSPDGSELLISINNKVVLVPRLGDQVKEYGIGFFTCWLKDGELFASAVVDIKEINIVNKNTLETKKIKISGFKWLIGIDWSNNRNEFLLLTTNEKKYEIFTLNPDTKKQNLLFELKNRILDAKWTPDGKAIYLLLERDDGTNEFVKIYENGNKKILISGIKVANNFSITKNADVLAYSRILEFSNLWLSNLENDSVVDSYKLTEGTALNYEPHFSPDNKFILYNRYNNIFKMDIENGKSLQLTFSEKNSESPCWSPDGTKIAYSQIDSNYNIVLIKEDGAYLKSIVNKDQSSPKISWFSDNQIMYHYNNNQNFKILNIDTELERPLVTNDSVGYIFDPVVSPSGNKIAVFWNRIEYGNIIDPINSKRRGKFAIGLWTIDIKNDKQEYISGNDFFPLKWSFDGNFIYANDLANSAIMKVPVKNEKPIQILKYTGDYWGADVSSDENRIVYSIGETKSDVWMMENFDPEVE